MDATAKSLDYLADQLATMEAHMIDPTEFGQLREQVAGLRRDLDDMAATMRDMSKALQSMQTTLTEARGGWRVLVMVGGTIGSVIALLWAAGQWIADHVVLR